jgi:hypothetical protein
MKLKTLFENITWNSSREENGKWKTKLGGKLTFQYQVRVKVFLGVNKTLKERMKGQSWMNKNLY